MYNRNNDNNYFTWKNKIHNLRNIFPTIHASNLTTQEKNDSEKSEVKSEKDENAESKVVGKLTEDEVLIINKDVEEYLSKESGYDRLKEMFRQPSPEKLSPEMSLVVHSAINTGMLVFVFSSSFGGYAASEKFIEKHQHKVFATKFSAVRTYNDAMMFGALRFGFKMGLKAAAFAGLFMLTSQSMACYRNKSSIWEYIAGGGLTCSILRISHGWRGFVAGGIIGLGFGLFGGLATLGILNLFNLTQEQRHYQCVYEQCREMREIKKIQSINKDSPVAIDQNAIL